MKCKTCGKEIKPGEGRYQIVSETGEIVLYCSIECKCKGDK